MQEFDRIKKYYTKAVLYYETGDPEALLWMGRKTAEAICRQLYEKEVSTYVGKWTLEKFIEELVKKNILPRSVLIPLRTIQDYGNFGTHDQGEESKVITKEYVRPCLHAMESLIKWYFRDYHKQQDIDFINHHSIEVTKEVDEAIARYQHDTGALKLFIEECLVEISGVETRASDIWFAYKNWYKTTKRDRHHMLGKIKFYSELERRDFPKVRSAKLANQNIIIGLAIKDSPLQQPITEESYRQTEEALTDDPYA